MIKLLIAVLIFCILSLPLGGLRLSNGLLSPAVALAQEPTFEVITYTVQAEPGFIFTTPNTHNWLLVTDNVGHLVYKKQGKILNPQIWGSQLSYFDNVARKFIVLNDNYESVDEWNAVGYKTDVHDLRLLSNGHAFLLVYKPYTVDLSSYGGYVTATVESCLIQELDQDKNLVWDWDSIDYLPITQTNHSLATPTVDYAHCNALEVDSDGNLLLSSRHLDEITKISRQTGTVIWRLGGLGNEFTFTNDTGFAWQHDIRRLVDGHLTLFDNGAPGRGYSRAVEYEIDEGTKVITRTWEYQGPFAFCCGNVQRLPEGNTFINWGPAHPTITEVTPDGQIVFAAEAAFSYRSYKAPWVIRYYLPLIWKD